MKTFLERMAVISLALAAFGLVGMIVVGMCGFYPSTIYYAFGFAMLCGFCLILLLGAALAIVIVFEN